MCNDDRNDFFLPHISILWCEFYCISKSSYFLVYLKRKSYILPNISTLRRLKGLAFLIPNICILWCEVFHCSYIPLYDDRKAFILPNICIFWCEIIHCSYIPVNDYRIFLLFQTFVFFGVRYSVVDIYENDDRKAFILPNICILWCEISHYSSIPM